MLTQSGCEMDCRILLLAPSRAEITHAVRTLEGDALRVFWCKSYREFADEFQNGLGVALVAEEALAAPDVQAFRALLGVQQTWSDVPVVLLSRASEERDTLIEALGDAGHVTVLDRPIRVRPLLSAVRAALRTRRRQYQVRELLTGLGETDRRKNEFLAMLGHELRNPLAAVRAAIPLIQGSVQDEARPAVEVISRQVRNLSGIVDDLLEVSRVMSGKIQLRPRRVDLNELAEHAARSVREAVRDRAQSLDVTVPDEPVIVDGDPMRLEQVLANLLHNAIKYTPVRGRITLRVSHAGSQAIVTVSDDGIGIAPEMLARIFEPFTQVGASIDRSDGGLGLGLPLVKRLVELHGGEISATSGGPTQGSTFTLLFPLSPAAGAAVAVTKRAATPIPAMHVERCTRVLLVDDNTDMLEMLRTLLERRGHDVDVATDGIGAVAKALANPPDVALVDIGLPGIDGYEVARRIRANRSIKSWLVAVTGYGQPEDRDRAIRAGFDRHLIKPVEPESLYRLLQELHTTPEPPQVAV